MKEIPLTKGYVALVDDEDFEELSKYKWYVRVAPKSKNSYEYTQYAWRPNESGLRPKTIKMHRQITNAEKGFDVDHVNTNGLDNQKKNLRVVSRTNNSRNARKKTWRGGATSQFKGVRWSKNRWQARIVVDRKEIHLGRFENEIIAALVYDTAARKYFNEHARLNFPYGIG